LDQWLGLVEGCTPGLARQAMPARGQGRQAAQKALAYFENNQDKMRYWDYRQRGLFIGSGVVEAGCKSVVGQRLKQSGMFWSLAGAENILSIRCVLENGQFNDCWSERFSLPPTLPEAA
jgi:hypothetical protein